MRLGPVHAACLVLATAGVSTAQQQMSPDAFLDQAIGRTLTFNDYTTGQRAGVEQFLRRDLSVWAQADGRCSYGRVEVRGPLLCFIYENFPDPDNCWMPFELEGDLVVMSAQSRQIQRVTQVTEDPVVCEGVPLS